MGDVVKLPTKQTNGESEMERKLAGEIVDSVPAFKNGKTRLVIIREPREFKMTLEDERDEE